MDRITIFTSAETSFWYGELLRLFTIIQAAKTQCKNVRVIHTKGKSIGVLDGHFDNLTWIRGSSGKLIFKNFILNIFRGKSLQTSLISSQSEKMVGVEFTKDEVAVIHLVRNLDFFQNVIENENSKNLVNVHIDFCDLLSEAYTRRKIRSLKDIVIKYFESRRIAKEEMSAIIEHKSGSFINKDECARFRSKVCDADNVKLVTFKNAILDGNVRGRPNKPRGTLFLGDMSFGPNLDSFEKLYKMYQTTQQMGPLYLVGPGTQDLSEKFPEVECLGYFEDLKSVPNASLGYYSSSTGAGVQNKILDYIALGCCVYTTNEMILELKAEDFYPLFIDESKLSFSDAIDVSYDLGSDEYCALRHNFLVSYNEHIKFRF